MLRLESALSRLFGSSSHKRDEERQRVEEDRKYNEKQQRTIQSEIASFTDSQKEAIRKREFFTATSLLAELKNASVQTHQIKALKDENERLQAALTQLQRDWESLQGWEVNIIYPLQQLLSLLEPKKVSRDSDFSPASLEELQEFIVEQGGMELKDLVHIVFTQVETRLATSEYVQYFAKLENVKQQFLRTGVLSLSAQEQGELIHAESNLEIEKYLVLTGRSESEVDWRENFLSIVDSLSEAIGFIPAADLIEAFADIDFLQKNDQAEALENFGDQQEEVDLLMAWDISSEGINQLEESELIDYVVDNDPEIQQVARNILLDQNFIARFGEETYRQIIQYIQFPDNFYENVVLLNLQQEETHNSYEWVNIFLQKFDKVDFETQQEIINYIYQINDDFGKILSCILSVPQYREFLKAEVAPEEDSNTEEWNRESLLNALQGLENFFDLESLVQHLLEQKSIHRANYPKIGSIRARLEAYNTTRQHQYFSKYPHNVLSFEAHRKHRVLFRREGSKGVWIAEEAGPAQKYSRTTPSGKSILQSSKPR